MGGRLYSPRKIGGSEIAIYIRNEKSPSRQFPMARVRRQCQRQPKGSQFRRRSKIRVLVRHFPRCRVHLTIIGTEGLFSRRISRCLLVSQRDHGIETRGAEGRDGAGD